MDALALRLARFGWRVREEQGELVLLGNGSPAAFRSEATLLEWLDKQKVPTMQPYYQDDKGIVLYHGRCEDVMPQLAAASFDAVITDEPYGTTSCAWDQVIPFDVMWRELKRLSKPRAANILFGREPFTSVLIGSNLGNYRHKWVWNKKLSGSFQNAKYQPLQIDEDVVVFGFQPVNYYPQMRAGELRFKGGHRGSTVTDGLKPFERYLSDEYYPTNILDGFGNTSRLDRDHPTQKPLALMEYLVKTYTNPGDTVLDFTSGSGTTLRACKNLGRRCVGIEMLLEYCEATVARLAPEFERALVDEGADLSDLPLFAP